jgi:coenzyme F420-reducing hydrogenase delta subunit
MRAGIREQKKREDGLAVSLPRNKGFMNHMPEQVKINLQPRLIGFLCENGAHAFYDVSNPVRRKLPANFVGLPVACINQVQTNEVLKAFLSGADGVLIAGCEACQCHENEPQLEAQFSELSLALAGYGIEGPRLRLEWIAATEEKKFLQAVNAMMETLRQLPPLRLPAELRNNIAHCG